MARRPAVARPAVGASLLLLLLGGHATAQAGTAGPTTSLGKAGGVAYVTAKFENVYDPAGPPAECPGARDALGGGGRVSGQTNAGRMTTVAPISTAGEGWLAEGRVLGMSAGQTVHAFATCGRTEAQYETSSVGLSSGFAVGLSAICPGGTKVTGGGVSGNGGELVIHRSIPIDGGDIDTTPDDGWSTYVTNTSGGSVTVTSYAVCAGSLKLRYAFAPKAVAPTSAGKATAGCPKGTVVVGGGFNGPDEGLLHASIPKDTKDAGKVPEDGWFARLHNPGANPATVTTHATCLKP